jgi:hypothetical protein
MPLISDKQVSLSGSGANLGSGIGMYAGASGSTLQFRSLTGGSENILIGLSGDSVTVDVVVGGIYQNNGNVLYVATTGSNTKPSRADHIGNPNLPFLTLDAAVAAAVSGDVIHVFPGSYTVTGNIAKSGVNWHFENNTTVTKTTSGTMFDTSSHSTGFNITGYAKFIKSTNTGNLFYFGASSLTYNIQCSSVASSVASPVFFVNNPGMTLNLDIDYATNSGNHIMFMNYSNSGGATVNINALSWYCTGGAVITGQWWYYTTLNINAAYIGSSVDVAIKTYNVGCSFNLNVARIEGVQYALQSGDGWSKLINVNCNYITGINDGGDSNKYYVTGHCRYYNGSVNAYLSGCNIINILGGYCRVAFDMGLEGSNSNIAINQSGGTSDLFINNYQYGIIFNVTGGTMNLRGNVMSGQVSNNSDRLISGGTLNVYDKFIYGANLDPSYTGYAALKLQSGTLRVFGAIHNFGDHPRATGIEWSGGNLIFENATVVTSNQYAHAVRGLTAGLSMKVTGRVSTNRVERDAILGGKYLIWKWQLLGVATTSVYINGSYVQETDTTTYNTVALLAQRMVNLINSTYPGVVVAYQDTPGTDTYFYVRSFSKGGSFTVGNGLNNQYSIFQLNSFPMGASGPGLIYCDPNVTA